MSWHLAWDYRKETGKKIPDPRKKKRGRMSLSALRERDFKIHLNRISDKI